MTLEYMSGFGNEFATQVVAGALPEQQNSPQKPAFGLYTEQFSGSAFTAPRSNNRRSWFYRQLPSAQHGTFLPYTQKYVETGPMQDALFPPNRLRWDPLPMPDKPTDWVDGLVSIATNGDAATNVGIGIHLYAINKSMTGRAFFCADGELLFVPQNGVINLVTEMGVLTVPPNHIGVIPRGLKFRVDIVDGEARGYVCENYGESFHLPDLGPIGSNGLANSRDFETPVAAIQENAPTQIIQKFGGSLWSVMSEHTPFDVVAWHGNNAPYRYDLSRFNTIGSISFDHPDPSIFTVLTSPSTIKGTANCDFVIFPPRWMVAEKTFRPPWFHRNIMSEYMGLIRGAYDAKTGGFLPGGSSLHNCMNAHGPDKASTETAMAADLKPHKIDGTMAFMFESCYAIRPTQWALDTDILQQDYDDCWNDFARAKLP